MSPKDSLIKKLTRPVEHAAQQFAKRGGKPKVPSGWEPGVEWDGANGTLTTTPLASAPSRGQIEALLKEAGFPGDPADLDFIEPYQFRAWQTTRDGEPLWLKYFKITVVSRTKSDRADINELIREIKRHKPAKREAPTGESAFVVVLCDWQLGKPDKDGTRGIVGRILKATDDVASRVRDLRKIGHDLGVLYVLIGGDLIEGCSEQYAQQAFRVELDRRDQNKIARRLIRDCLIRWSKLFDQVVVTAVGGNHGEHRKDGRSFTTFGDNDDVAIPETVAEILAANPEAYGHVSFAIPEDQLSVVLDVAGTRIGLIHGHQARAGGTPAVKIEKWWRGQMLGDHAVSDAHILITCHYHQFGIQQIGARWNFMAPTLDAGSDWFEASHGVKTWPGMLTFVTQDGQWSDLEVLR